MRVGGLIKVWIWGRANTAVQLKQGRRGQRGERMAGDYNGGGRGERPVSIPQLHQEFNVTAIAGRTGDGLSG